MENAHDPLLEEAVDAMVTLWDQELRRTPEPPAARSAIRAFLFEVMPSMTGGPSNDHAFFMFEVAARLTSLNRIADAFEVLDWIGGLYAHQHDLDMAVPSILALTDWAVRLSAEDLGCSRAIAVMRGAAGRVSLKAGIPIQRAACRAMVQVALLSTTIPGTIKDGTIKRTMKPWQDIVDRWAGNEDAELLGRVAQALCNIGFIHLQLGEDKAAQRHFAHAVALPKGAGPTNASAREFFAVAANADCVLAAVNLPRSAEFKTDYLIAQRRNDHRMQRRGFWIPWLLAGAPRNHTHKLLDIARRKHRMSAGKVKAMSCCGEPFVLLLRNFDLVEWSGTSPEPDSYGTPETFLQTIRLNRRGAKLLQQLACRVPMVQVASTRSAELELRDTFGARWDCEAQLYLADDTWLDTVTHLITLAETIVIWADSMTSALGQEIAAIRLQGRAKDTVILLEEVDDDPEERAMLRMNNLNKPPREQLTPDSSDLAGFPHVVGANHIPEGDICDRPPFLGLRQHYEELWSLPQDRRITRLLSRLEAASNPAVASRPAPPAPNARRLT